MQEKISRNPLSYIVLISIALILRVLFIHNGGLWLDEIWSMRISAADKSVNDIITACISDTHPPLFDILLNLWLRLFPHAEFAGRYLALTFGIAGIACTYYYAKRISNNTWTAFLATGLVCFSHFHSYYSGEARFYTLLYLLSLVLIANLYLFLRDSANRNLLWIVMAGSLIIWTHYYGSILLFVLSILVFVLWLMKEIKLKQLLYFACAGLIILLIYSPWIKNMFAGKALSSWMAVPSIGGFFEYFYNYTGKNPLETLFMMIAIIGSPLFFKKDKKLFVILSGTILLGFLVPFIVSHLAVPMLHMRYTIIYFPAVILITAFFWTETSWIKGQWKWVLPLLVFTSSIINVAFINKDIRTEREPWREIAKTINNENKAKKIPVYAQSEFWINYYLLRNGSSIALAPANFNGEEQFLYMRSPFDTPDATKDIFRADQVIKSISFEGDFELILINKAPK